MSDGKLKWRPDHDEAIARWRREGYSGAQIAGLLWSEFRVRYSRNAVIGRLHRLGLTDKNAPRLNRPARARPEPKPKIIPPAPAIKIDLPALICVEVVPRNVSLLELQDCQCRWPDGEGATITFCGHSVLPDHSYCGPHFALSIGSGTYSERQAGRVAA